MKKIRIVSLVLVVMMLCACLASCGGSASKTTCKFSVVVKGEYAVDHVDCPVSADGATVLDVLKMALTDLGFDYEIDANNLKTLVVDGTQYTVGSDADGKNFWFWSYTVNGEEPKGSAAINNVAEGDDIVFVFTSQPVEADDAGTENVDAEGENTNG